MSLLLPVNRRYLLLLQGRIVYGNKNWSSQLTGVGFDYGTMRASIPLYSLPLCLLVSKPRKLLLVAGKAGTFIVETVNLPFQLTAPDWPLTPPP